MFLIPRNRNILKVFDVYYATLKSNWLMLVPLLVMVAALAFASLYLRASHVKSVRVASDILGLLSWVFWIAYLWVFTDVLFELKFLQIAPLKSGLIKIIGITLIASAFDGIITLFYREIASVAGKVLLYFVGTYLVYIWFAIALACIAKGFKFKKCAGVPAYFMADNVWLLIAFLFAIFIFHYAVFSIPSLTTILISGQRVQGSPLVGFLWFVERLLILPLATVAFVEKNPTTSRPRNSELPDNSSQDAQS